MSGVGGCDSHTERSSQVCNFFTPSPMPLHSSRDFSRRSWTLSRTRAVSRLVPSRFTSVRSLRMFFSRSRSFVRSSCRSCWKPGSSLYPARPPDWASSDERRSNDMLCSGFYGRGSRIRCGPAVDVWSVFERRRLTGRCADHVAAYVTGRRAARNGTGATQSGWGFSTNDDGNLRQLLSSHDLGLSELHRRKERDGF